MIGAMMVLKGIWKGAGVFNMEQLDPDPFMDQLNRQGLPWQVVPYNKPLEIDEGKARGKARPAGKKRTAAKKPKTTAKKGKTKKRRGEPSAVTDRWNNLGQVKTPVYIVDEVLLERNCQILDSVQKRTGCKILLALKGYAMWSTFPLVRQYLCGISASGPIEARLGREEFGKEVHTYAPAYSDDDMREVVRCSDHIIFNSSPSFGSTAPRSRQARAWACASTPATPRSRSICITPVAPAAGSA